MSFSMSNDNEMEASSPQQSLGLENQQMLWESPPSQQFMPTHEPLTSTSRQTSSINQPATDQQLLWDIHQVPCTSQQLPSINQQCSWTNEQLQPINEQVPSTKQSQMKINRPGPIKIVEQPKKLIRFRYKSEDSKGELVTGINTPENKSSITYPSIKVDNCRGKALVIISCVTKDKPYMVHPNKLVPSAKVKNGECRDGILRRIIDITGPQCEFSFENVTIQRTARNAIPDSLKQRELLKVDPFSHGYQHDKKIDSGVVRLCFQVLLEGPGGFFVPIKAVVSEPIYDKQTRPDLKIIKLSDCVSYVDGGQKDIILVCKKVSDDIKVRFFEETSDWSEYAESHIHKPNVIWFQTPPYHNLDVKEPVKVLVELCRAEDNAVSEPVPFELWPIETNFKGKRRKYEPPPHLLNHLGQRFDAGFVANNSNPSQSLIRSISSTERSILRASSPSCVRSSSYDSVMKAGTFKTIQKAEPPVRNDLNELSRDNSYKNISDTSKDIQKLTTLFFDNVALKNENGSNPFSFSNDTPGYNLRNMDTGGTILCHPQTSNVPNPLNNDLFLRENRVAPVQRVQNMESGVGSNPSQNSLPNLSDLSDTLNAEKAAEEDRGEAESPSTSDILKDFVDKYL